jgi:predicted transcriptional regulator
MEKIQFSVYLDAGVKAALDHYCAVTKRKKVQFTEEAFVGRALYLYEKAGEAIKASPKNNAVKEYFGKEMEGLKLFRLRQDQIDLADKMAGEGKEEHEIQEAVDELARKAGVR